MIMISTYSGIMVYGDQKEGFLLSKVHVLTFNFAEPFDHNYLHRGSGDNYNAMRPGVG